MTNTARTVFLLGALSGLLLAIGELLGGSQGLVIAFAVGFLLAALAYYVPVFRLAVHQRISPAVNSFPGIGWIMLAIMWFGIGDVTVVFAITATLLPFVLINLREGFGRESDYPPPRFFREEMPDGPGKGSKLNQEEYDRLLDDYYEARGWDKKTGEPTPEKLRSLGLP